MLVIHLRVLYLPTHYPVSFLREERRESEQEDSLILLRGKVVARLFREREDEEDWLRLCCSTVSPSLSFLLLSLPLKDETVSSAPPPPPPHFLSLVGQGRPISCLSLSPLFLQSGSRSGFFFYSLFPKPLKLPKGRRGDKCGDYSANSPVLV